MKTRICPTCQIKFKTASYNKLYCKRNHQPNRMRYRKRSPARLRGRWVTRYGQPISKFFMIDIMNIYSKRPEGMEVDHIIPLNHPDVCGLHVPWNLQYLDRDENNKKSNRV